MNGPKVPAPKPIRCNFPAASPDPLMADRLDAGVAAHMRACGLERMLYELDGGKLRVSRVYAERLEAAA